MKKGITMKDILEDDSIFRPKRRDLMKEDNIVFHTNSRDDDLIITKAGQITDAENPMDYERMKELENYRKRFEEALVRIEDKEDVMAFQQARREIDDEFVEDAAPSTPGGQTAVTQGDENTVQGEGGPNQEDNLSNAAQQDGA